MFGSISCIWVCPTGEESSECVSFISGLIGSVTELDLRTTNGSMGHVPVVRRV